MRTTGNRRKVIRLKSTILFPEAGVCIGDYDGDNLPDVFLTQANVGSRLYLKSREHEVCRCDGRGRNCRRRQRAGRVIRLMSTTDSDLDLYICNDERPNQLFINNGEGSFQERAAAAGIDFNGASVTATFADYDHDGDLDLYLVTNRKEPQHEVPTPKRLPDGSFDISEVNREFVDVIVSKDGNPRVVKAAQYDHLYRNNGDGTFVDVSQGRRTRRQLLGVVCNLVGLQPRWLDRSLCGQ